MTTTTAGWPARIRIPVMLVFVLSGAAGLIDEIAWSRQLVLVFGNTTQAVSAILTGFFGGMAIGATVGGRVADRVRSPLRLYALLEIALAAVVLATPITFRFINEIYASAYPDLQDSPTALALVRMALAARGAWSRDDHDGRDPARPDPVPDPRRSSQRSVRAALRGQHHRGDHRHAPRRSHPDRALRSQRRRRDRSRMLGSRGHHRAGPGAKRRSARWRVTGHGPGGSGAGGRALIRHAGSSASSPGIADRIWVGSHVARISGALDASPFIGHRQHDLCLHRDPDAVPDGSGDRGADLRDHPASPEGPDASHRDRSVADRRPRAGWSRLVHRSTTGVERCGWPGLDRGAVCDGHADRAGNHRGPWTHLPSCIGAPACRRRSGRIERRHVPWSQHVRCDPGELRHPVRPDPSDRLPARDRVPRPRERAPWRDRPLEFERVGCATSRLRRHRRRARGSPDRRDREPRTPSAAERCADHRGRRCAVRVGRG